MAGWEGPLKTEFVYQLQRGLRELLRRCGYAACRIPQEQTFSDLIPDKALYQIPGDFHRYYRPWEAPEFGLTLPAEAVANTMLPMLKIYMLLCLLRQTRSLSGAVLEAGVWNGGSARLLADYLDSISAPKALWLLDTFEGYDSIDREKDGLLPEKGQMKGKPLGEVKALFAHTRTTVHFIKGAIPGALSDVDVSELSFAHIDVNLYEPTRQATEFCLERMPRGGIVVFDDYNWPATYGARQGIDEACARFGQETISIPESSQAFLIRN